MTSRAALRSWVLQIGLGVLALALVALYLRGRGDGAPAEAPPPPPPLARGEGTRVERIERMERMERLPGAPGDSTGGGAIAIVLERQDPFWRIRAPRDDLASTQTVGELLRALEELRVERLLDRGDPADFGLAPPRHRLVLSLRGGRVREIEVGDYTPGGLEVYARWTGLDGIAIVPRYLKTRFLESDLPPWREAELLPPRPAAIDSVTIELPGGRLRLRRLEHRVWRFAEPADREADGGACERAVAAFWRFPFTEFVDDPGWWNELGLDPPRAVWVVHRASAIDTLEVGARLGEGRAAVRLRGRVPGLTSDEPYDLLVGGLASLEERGLFRGQADDQRLVALLGEGIGRAWLQREGRWLARDLSAPEARAAAGGQPPDTTDADWRVPRDPALAGDLTNLLAIRGERWADPLARAADPARDDAPWSVHLWDRSGRRAWALFYPDDPVAVRRWADAGTAAGADPPILAGRAVGSAQPARPMEIRSQTLFHWYLRLLRPRVAQDAGAR